MEESSQSSLLPKYFLHGIAFSLISLVLTILYAVILVILILAGLLIGLIIGILLFMVFIGGLNALLTYQVWKVEIKTNWTSLIAHGFVLLIVLFFAHIPGIAVNLVIPSLVTQIIVFVVYCFIDGYVARKVAGLWEEAYDEPLIFPEAS